ncbi:MAG: alpha/beta fold hydrolase [Acidobacteria bacterium]|nr:alpha/beta fold hydrolase [Acidobacteriota bacterium]
MPAFVPKLNLRGGHRMTVFAWARPRHLPRLPAPAIRFFDVAPDARVLAHCHWHPDRHDRATLIELHGLEGSSEAHYMRGLADKAYAAGFNVIRLNQRNCGGTEGLSHGLYHSGLTSDPAAVIRELIDVDRLPAFAVAGYSLGGNLALKLAGEYGDAHPPELRAVTAVSPTMDLASCVRALERRENLLYEWNFVRSLKRRMRRKARLFPELYDLRALGRVRTVREFDEAYTAPHHGFRDAADYYYRASSLRVADRIRIPTLVIGAEDDPFVPSEQFRTPEVTNNPFVTVMLTEHGGHCAFIEDAREGDGYWAERMIVEFARRHAQRAREQVARW